MLVAQAKFGKAVKLCHMRPYKDMFYLPVGMQNSMPQLFDLSQKWRVAVSCPVDEWIILNPSNGLHSIMHKTVKTRGPNKGKPDFRSMPIYLVSNRGQVVEILGNLIHLKVLRVA